jgi:hypothetical protein
MTPTESGWKAVVGCFLSWLDVIICICALFCFCVRRSFIIRTADLQIRIDRAKNMCTLQYILYMNSTRHPFLTYDLALDLTTNMVKLIVETCSDLNKIFLA